MVVTWWIVAFLHSVKVHASFVSQPAIGLPAPLRCCKTLISILSHPKSALDIHTHSTDNLVIGYFEAYPPGSQLVGPVNQLKLSCSCPGSKSAPTVLTVSLETTQHTW